MKYLKIVILLVVTVLLCGCDLFGKSNPKVTIDYNCEGIEEYKCSTMDDKLNCIIIMPECKGYSFVGWYDAKASGNEVNLDSDFTKATTIYAVWEEDGSPKQTVVPPKEDTNPSKPADSPKEEEPAPVVVVEKAYKVTFNLNGGSGNTPQAIEVKLDEMMPSIGNAIPTRNNYTFMGWYDNKEYTLGNRYYDESNEPVKYYDVKKSITLYAGWKVNKTEVVVQPEEVVEKTYKVTFNLNGGSGTAPSEVNIKNNELMPSIGNNIPTRNGYTFTGWYDNKDYTKGKVYYDETNQAVKYFDSKKDITLYAGWSKDLVVMSYKLIFNPNGGKGGQTDAVMVKKGESLPRITSTAPTKKGYTFLGWYDSLTGGTEYYNVNGVSNITYNKEENTTLYAHWKANTYSISFNINGGTGSTPTSANVTYGNMVPSITKTVPTRSGHTFVGWYDNSDYTQGKAYYSSKNESVLKYDKEGNTTLYAGWSKNAVATYVVAFNSNGGTGGQTASVSVSKGSPMPSINKTAPTKDGYTFNGWYDSLSGGTQYYTKDGNSARNYDKSSGCTLYAQYTAITYKISYTLNGGVKGSSTPVDATYDKVITINNPTKTFTVSIDANGTGVTLSSTTVSSSQSFLGWTADSNLDTKNALYGSTTNTNSSWTSKTTKVKDIYFRNLMSKSGTVNLTANWSSVEVTLPTITKSGETCGYSTTRTGSIAYSSGSKYKPSITTNNAVLYAVCGKVTYKVVFDSNGGTGGQTAAVYASYGEAMPSISLKPRRDNYTFTGYYDAKEGGTQYYTSDLKSAKTYDKTTGTILYAHWGGKYTINYDCNGGINPPKSQTTQEGAQITLNSNTCTKDNYVFVHWVDPTGTVWKDKWSGNWTYKESEHGIVNDTLTLKAIWGTPITAATFNIGYFNCGSGKTKCEPTRSQIAKVLRDAKIDIVGIQEAKTSADAKKLGTYSKLTHIYTKVPKSVNTILSRYSFISTTSKGLEKCEEPRSVEKVVINIDGVKVSFYNTHYSYQKKPHNCPVRHMKNVAKIIKKDPNPVILTGDTNTTAITNYNNYLKPLGFVVAAHNTAAKGIEGKESYCDSVFIKSTDAVSIEVLESVTENVYGKLSDHNLVYARLAIVKNN